MVEVEKIDNNFLYYFLYYKEKAKRKSEQKNENIKMDAATLALNMIIESNADTLKKSFVAQFSPSHTNALYNVHTWEIHISGKGTFENKEAIKAAGFYWNKHKKVWTKHVAVNDVPLEDVKKQQERELQYYHSRGLTFPYCQAKCSKKECNETKSKNNPDGLCSICVHKNKCVGGLVCKGWMSVACDYEGKTLEGDTCCQKCRFDASNWADEGRRINGPGGWFANDNS